MSPAVPHQEFSVSSLLAVFSDMLNNELKLRDRDQGSACIKKACISHTPRPSLISAGGSSSRRNSAIMLLWYITATNKTALHAISIVKEDGIKKTLCKSIVHS